MKKFLLQIPLFLFVNIAGYAQTVRACIDTNKTYPNSVNIWLRADLTTPQDTCASSLQFSIAIPDTFSGVLPTDFIVDSSAWPGSIWYTEPPYLEAGFWHYDILTAFTPCMNYTANADYFAMRVSPIGGTASPYNYYLLCLPDGGVTTGSALFYHFGAWLSDGSSLFFSRPGTDSFNQLSYDLSGNLVGTSISWSRIIKPNTPLALENISLKGKWINKNDALLNWEIVGDDDNITDYTIAKSMNGISYVPIKNIIKRVDNFYQYIDVNASGKVFYRIQANHNNGIVSLSNIVFMQNNITNSVFIYPIPVQDFVNINIGDEVVIIYLMASNGQVLKSEKCNANILKMDMSSYANGLYFIKIISSKGLVNVLRFNKTSK